MIYYLILLGILILRVMVKKDTAYFFWTGFYLFLTSVVLDLLKIKDLSEFVIGVGFIFLMAGLLFTIKENKF